MRRTIGFFTNTDIMDVAKYINSKGATGVEMKVGYVAQDPEEGGITVCDYDIFTSKGKTIKVRYPLLDKNNIFDKLLAVAGEPGNLNNKSQEEIKEELNFQEQMLKELGIDAELDLSYL